MCAAWVNCDDGIVAASNASTRVATSASLANSLVFNFGALQRVQAGASLVQIKSRIIAPMMDMMNPAG